MKDWTEPNGKFIMNIPIEWQYRNPVFPDFKNESPYSFELYKNSIGCFQISVYALADKGINPHIPIQKANAQLDWTESNLDNDKFKVYLYYAQVEDLLIMCKYICDLEKSKTTRFKSELEKVKTTLQNICVIPINERKLAANLAKHDNFIGSLAASHDLLRQALESGSFIESIVVLANQIDAFLRSSIILLTQNQTKSNSIETKYIFQDETEKGINERNIYKSALDLNIIGVSLSEQLNKLYDRRNRVIHRYIISHIKTRDLIDIVHDYCVIHEEVRLILEKLESYQRGSGFGIYGRKNADWKDEYNHDNIRIISAMANDKHLIERYKRDI